MERADGVELRPHPLLEILLPRRGDGGHPAGGEEALPGPGLPVRAVAGALRAAPVYIFLATLKHGHV